MPISREQTIIRKATELTKLENIMGLEELYNTIPPCCDVVFIFKSVFLNACINDKHAIIRWLIYKAKQLSPIDKIRIKDVFVHAKYKLVTFNKKEMEDLVRDLNS